MCTVLHKISVDEWLWLLDCIYLMDRIDANQLAPLSDLLAVQSF